MFLYWFMASSMSSFCFVGVSIQYEFEDEERGLMIVL
jgi:hypothetical protein